MSVDIPKTYLYHVYKGGDFLGVLQNVTSQFTYSQDINSNAVSIDVEVSISADVADIPVTPLQDEAGNNLLDEAGNILYEERAVDVVGSFNPDALIQEDNILKVYEISSTYPNGVLKFDGYIENWEAILGTADDKITFTALSKGIDLVDYLVEGASTLDQSQATENAVLSLYEDTATHYASGWSRAGQSFTVGNSPLKAISIFALSDPNLEDIVVDVTVSVYDNANFSGTPLATVTRPIHSTNDNYIEMLFTFPNTVIANAGTVLYFSVTALTDSGAPFVITYKNGTNAYANGTMYLNSYGGGSGGGLWIPVPQGTVAASSDLYFKTWYLSGPTTTTYNSTDPASMLTDIISNYNSEGGTVTTTASSVDATGTTASYTFKVNTILEAIQKCLELATSDYYWYVDPATNVLYFKQTPTTATHKFIKGRHFGEITIGGTVENVRNVVYFSGGDDGTGTNIFRQTINPTSLSIRRRRMERLSDNRVTLTDTADLIADNFLTTHADIVYSSPVDILEGTYDLDSINVGDTVQLEGFGNFADTLLLQVARIVPHPERVEIVLGVLLKRQSDAVLEAVKAVGQLQTVDNPSTPS